MKPSIWPDWMEHIRAKSVAFGGESLADHTWEVLRKLAELRALRPALPGLAGVPRLWHCLFWACFLHDFGKAARGFQARLSGGPPWYHRHEVLSLAFLDWIAPGLADDEQTWVLAAIASHHRDAEDIGRLYPDLDDDPLAPLLAEVDADAVTALWRWVDECAASWRDALGFDAGEVGTCPLPDLSSAVEMVMVQGVRRTRAWLFRYGDWIDDLPRAGDRVRLLGVLLRGITTSADHMASAHLARIPPPVQESWEDLAARILSPLRAQDPSIEPYAHQRASAAAAGSSALLIAPTGSGKTEAALYWALGDGKAPLTRLFYALPYQASMNAMFDRLRDPDRGFGPQAVGLQHGRALQALHARLLQSEEGVVAAAAAARWERNLNTLHARPVKVFSPYQMLKALFQLRGFEAVLTDYAGGAFVLDEIHAYDPERLALILALIAHLRVWYGARFFVMSATFPEIIRQRLVEALGTDHTITASPTLFTRFRRHRLQMLGGELTTDGVDRIVADVREGKQVLACANTVRRAQELYAALQQAGLPAHQVLLLHSRYTFGDRHHRELSIRSRCGADVPLDQRAPLALVATQVVEVSLDIDLDTIYSDPAPLEALLQRFGRVNRRGRKGICPVHVFREPSDGQGVYGRRDDRDQPGRIVQVTLAELEQHDNAVIDEAETGVWLDAIYADPMLRAQWNAAYQRVADQAALILRDLQPFTSDPRREDEFEQLFDGVEVIPRCFEQQYLDHMVKDEFIEASNYLVSISKQKFAILRRQGKVRPAVYEGSRRAWVVDLDYDTELGLHFDAPASDPDWS
ncbi:MAG: CRISPR-associated helicase Cas3' [Chloroflexaceae bacterium]|nr:CRISPR-associated helicase Cas3' [Chloroflexaceae bacterium]